jgi:predicted RNase H-like HicB family nuclease
MIHQKTFTFTARFQPVEDGWIMATLDELPNLVTQGHTIHEAKEMLVDALYSYMCALAPNTSEQSEQPQESSIPLQLSIAI